MFIKRKKNRSGTVSVVVAEKNSGIYRELITIGISKSPEETGALMSKAREWIDREQERRHPRLDLFGNGLTGSKSGVTPDWIYSERNGANARRNC